MSTRAAPPALPGSPPKDSWQSLAKPLDKRSSRGLAVSLLLTSLMALAACSSPAPPKPAELPPNVALIGVRQAWAANVGPATFPQSLRVVGNAVFVSSSDGTIASLDGRTGQDNWRTKLEVTLSSGVGSDGRYAAAISTANELITLDAGREAWRFRLQSRSFTPPLVAGGRVFVLGGDRSVSAFDAQTGRRLWSQSRTGEPLVLRQAGLLMAHGDTLVAGLGGRLVGMNPANGSSRWEVPVAVSRGTNDVERLVDVVGHASRVGETICVRAFQSMVGCVDASRGSLVWNRPANGATGVAGDDRSVFGAESDGKVIAFRRTDGERQWETDRLKLRQLSAPLAVGRSVVVGDGTGVLHLLSREDGSPLNRLATDGSAIEAAPALVGETLVVLTRNGGVFGFRPE